MAESRFDVAVLVGSLRKESYNRKLAHVLVDFDHPRLKLAIVEIGQLPFFNQDDEGNSPQTWVDFRRRIAQATAVLFVTAEYNRSTPAVLKNAIDVASRPYGHSVWNGKPGAIVSSSPGAIGAFGANHHLRQSMVFLNVPMLQQPEMYLGHVDKLFGADGKLANDGTRDFLRKFLDAFAAWIGTVAGASSPARS
jgi:chromate reductase